MTSPFPAYRCRFYSYGVCLHEELVNPDLREEYRCRRLAVLVRDWDEFINRADAFGLSEEEAARIWEERFHRNLDSDAACPHMRPDFREGGDVLLDCRSLYRNACLLLMPSCQGRCEHFAVAGAKTGLRPGRE